MKFLATFTDEDIFIDEAILLLENDVPTTYEGKFIQQRDLVFLCEVTTITKSD